MRRVEVEEYLLQAYAQSAGDGLLLTSVGEDGVANVMTIGWWLFGLGYHGNPICVVAVTPLRHTYRLLEEVGEFVVAVPDWHLKEAVAYCGRFSGRDGDKFAATGLTLQPSQHVRPPSIAECTANIECRIYHRQYPPHQVLTPEHRRRPLSAQHTIYYAEVLGAYAGERAAGTGG